MAKDEKKPELKAEPFGVGVIIYPEGGNKYRIEAVTARGNQVSAQKVDRRSNARVALGIAQTMLEDACAKGLK